MTRPRGFTLLELMVVVAIIAILAAIALPSYSEYVRRSRVTEAISTLSGMRVKMEQYYQDNRRYDGSCLPATVAPKPADTANWQYLCAPAPAGNNYFITATGLGTVAGYQYTIDQANNRTTVMAPPSTWPSNAACWVLKADGSC